MLVFSEAQKGICSIYSNTYKDLIMYRFKLSAALATVLAVMASGSAFANPILDQSFVVPSPVQGTVVGNPSFVQAQTFTAGLSGQLAEVDVFVSQFNGTPQENPNVMILGTNALGVPDSNQILANLVLLPSQVPVGFGSFVHLNVIAFNITVAPGEVLAIAMQSNELEPIGVLKPHYSWDISADNLYTGGNLFLSSDSGNQFFPAGSPSGSADVGFRTYVEVSPVPEPSIAISML